MLKLSILVIFILFAVICEASPLKKNKDKHKHKNKKKGNKNSTSVFVVPQDDMTFSSGNIEANNQFEITWEQFQAAFTSNGYSVPDRAEYDAYVCKPSAQNAISSVTEMAMLLAHVLHESGGLVYKNEIGCPQESKCRAYQNPSWNPSTCGPSLNQPCKQTPATPDTLYFGRGYMQLSWTVNYDAASWGIYGDDRLWRNPDLVANIDNSWDTAIWYWKTTVHPNPDVQAGKFGAATRLINGALECGGGPSEPLARKRWEIYKNVFRAFQICGEPIENGCYN